MTSHRLQQCAINNVIKLLFILLTTTVYTTRAQASIDVHAGINYGIHAGIALGICVFIVLGLTGLINLIKFKMLGKTRPVRMVH